MSKRHAGPVAAPRRALRLVVLAALPLAACSEGPVAPADEPQEQVQLAPVLAAVSADAIPNEYIVVLRELPARAQGALQAVVLMLNDHGLSARFVYDDAIVGFAAYLTPHQLERVRRHPLVDYVEADQSVQVDATQIIPSSGHPWGIDRIDQRNRPLSRSYTYNTTASNVYAYVIDTGIDAGHSEFGGRASNVYDAFGGNGNDCHGHGTHVAGTVGGTTWGVAKQVRLRGLRVLNCSGSGSTSGIIAAVNWVRTNRSNPAVANLSLGGGFSSALNSAINSLANSGVFVAVAAGNESTNACNRSPASASAAFTTAASTSSDRRASYSNYGSCVDAYAPGSSIRSAWIGSGSTEIATISGTSMASPHVAGVAALYKAVNGNASSSSISSWLSSNATANVISGNRSGTPNRLLYKSNL
jgi:subtilisin family serine protease